MESLEDSAAWLPRRLASEPPGHRQMPLLDPKRTASLPHGVDALNASQTKLHSFLLGLEPPPEPPPEPSPAPDLQQAFGGGAASPAAFGIPPTSPRPLQAQHLQGMDLSASQMTLFPPGHGCPARLDLMLQASCASSAPSSQGLLAPARAAASSAVAKCPSPAVRPPPAATPPVLAQFPQVPSVAELPLSPSVPQSPGVSPGLARLNLPLSPPAPLASAWGGAATARDRPLAVPMRSARASSLVDPSSSRRSSEKRVRIRVESWSLGDRQRTASTLGGRTVTWQESDTGSVHKSVMSIEPYCEIYGAHPGSFHFGADGTMLPVAEDANSLLAYVAPAPQPGIVHPSPVQVADPECFMAKSHDGKPNAVQLAPGTGRIEVDEEMKSEETEDEDSESEICLVGCRGLHCKP